ncbi:MAG: ankyrin repeat domain-containing protein [Melioribacteraceae bacterium]|nr:ankyrin repeat domain-containing protein [Melioribacteraceae bacterium]
MKKCILFLCLSTLAVAQNISNLSDAVRYYHGTKVGEYLKSGSSPHTIVDDEPAICYAARANGVNAQGVFDLLLEFGADPKSIGKDGNSLLSIAMSRFNSEQAIKLIKRGADLNYKNKGTIPPPLLMAVTGKYNWPKSSSFPDLIRFMIDNKADVNIQGSSGTTALTLAVYGRDLDLVKYFIEYNANPNLTDDQGETPLMKASGMGYFQIVDLLLKSGANPNIIPKDKETALMRAAKGGYKDVVLILLEHGAKTNLKNTWKETALDLAKQNGHKDIEEVLRKSKK